VRWLADNIVATPAPERIVGVRDGQRDTEVLGMPKILVVEDDDRHRDLLSRRLHHNGFDVIVADNGASAVDAARRELPDIILMDIKLPEQDGWAATRELKGEDNTRGIPIIALTALDMNEQRDKSFDAGCDEFESKPLVFRRLLAKIDKCLHEKGL